MLTRFRKNPFARGSQALGKGRLLSIRGYVLGVALLAVVGWCMIQESVKQTQARYELAELIRREEAAKLRLDKLRTHEQELRSPARLASLVRDKRLKLVVLGSAKPVAPESSVAVRQPGEVSDAEKILDANGRVDVASAGQW